MGQLSNPRTYCWIIALVFILKCTLALENPAHSKVDKELLLTKQEKVALDKFRGALDNMNIPKTLNFVRQDLILIRWLRAKNLNVNVAVHDFLQFIEWTKKIKLDIILTEDWSKIAEDHPFSTKDAVDLEGRPVAYTSALVGWNLRRTVLQGKREVLMRYMYKIAFEMYHRTMDASKTNPNVTTFSVIFNADGFNPFIHSCALCIASYVTMFDVYERFFPGFVHELIAINAPQAFVLVVETLRPVMSQNTRKAIRIFDSNKNKWKPFLDSRIDPKYLPSEFGGTKLDW